MNNTNKMKSHKNICLIYNYAQHYRKGVFVELDKKLSCDFYFGDKLGDIKKMDYKLISNFKGELKNIYLLNPFYFQKGVLRLFFKNYDRYIFLGEYLCLSTWFFLLLSKFSKKKIFLWTHGWYGNENIIKRVVKKIFFSLGDGIFLYGNYAKKIMIEEGFNEAKLHVIYNSLDYDKQLSVRKQLLKTNVFKKYFNNDYPVLIFIGRLTKVKKLDQLIEARKIIEDKGVDVNVVFIGKGEEEANLKQMCNDRFWFYGKSYEEEELGELIYNADLCVSPGNVGLTAMHSLVYGTPVITHSNFTEQMPEFEVISEGKTGVFFEQDNIEDLAEKIIDYLKDVNREEIRQNCYNVIDDFYNPNYQLSIIKKVVNL